ncbi:MAG: helix-turn-helix domain-containing protein [Eubacterium sp.]
MNQYITGAFIKKLREDKGLTQKQLADKVFVSEKTVSKWETGRGYPDISLIEDLAKGLGVSVIELMSGNNITNTNRSCNMRSAQLYVCPICGNIVYSIGEAVVCCCGINLLPLEIEEDNQQHTITMEPVEDEYYLSSQHPMTKSHYISFIAAFGDDSCEIIKLYPEGNCEARIKAKNARHIYYYCNRHGLYKLK